MSNAFGLGAEESGWKPAERDADDRGSSAADGSADAVHEPE